MGKGQKHNHNNMEKYITVILKQLYSFAFIMSYKRIIFSIYCVLQSGNIWLILASEKQSFSRCGGIEEKSMSYPTKRSATTKNVFLLLKLSIYAM